MYYKLNHNPQLFPTFKSNVNQYTWRMELKLNINPGNWMKFQFKSSSWLEYRFDRKPLRYETVQTKTRCQCWMVFTWISVAMMCCPPLLGFQKPIFDREAFICMLDWGNMAAYTITLSILVLGPSVITIVYTYCYIFTMMRRLRSGVLIHDKEYATALSENLSNPSHIMSFVLVMAFWVSWAPYAGLRIYTVVNGPPQVIQMSRSFCDYARKYAGKISFCILIREIVFIFFER